MSIITMNLINRVLMLHPGTCSYGKHASPFVPRLRPPNTLQAVFCQNMGCLQLDDSMIWQAARAAVAARSCRPDADAKTARTFWVIYCMEKQLCFEGHIGSVCLPPNNMTINSQHTG